MIKGGRAPSLRSKLWITAALLLAPLPSTAADVIVTDGDAIKLNGKAYKLDGIDAPERDTPQTDGVL